MEMPECMIIYSFRYYIHRTTQFIKFFVKIYLPFLYIILILVLSSFIPITGNLSRDISLTLLKLVIFMVFSLPLIWLANKKTGIVKTFFDMVFLRLGKK